MLQVCRIATNSESILSYQKRYFTTTTCVTQAIAASCVCEKKNVKDYLLCKVSGQRQCATLLSYSFLIQFSYIFISTFYLLQINLFKFHC